MISSAAFLLFLLPFLVCCGKSPDAEAESRTTTAALQEKLQNCLPEKKTQKDFKLAVVSITHQADETRVNLVAFNPADPLSAGKALTKKSPEAGMTEKKGANTAAAIDFDAPTYLMSRGRWLINETERVYLIDESCREYKLKDRQFLMRQAAAKSGRVRLAPGEACEVQLSFGKVADNAQGLLLVYGQQVLAMPLNIH